MVYFRKECTTRRLFCKRLAGIAVTGAFVDLEAAAAPKAAGKAVNQADNRVVPANVEPLIAVCGTYCGACPMYINNQTDDKQKIKGMFERYMGRSMNMNIENLVCDGCLSGGHIAFHCQKCEMRLCAADKADVTRCSDCPDFPCSRFTDFSNDGRLHHAELPDNLRNLKKMGIKDWARYERERWQCPKCSGPLAWYDGECSNCGTARSERLFSLTKDG
jgi:hypothetical protein